MSCKCGHQFCWTCLHPFNDFNYNHISCSPNPKTLKALTRIVKIRHMAQLNHTDSDQETQTETEAKRKKTAKNRYHKASMLLKAVNQRKEAERDKRRHAPITSLVGKICKAMSTDMQFQEEVLLRLGFPKATMTNWGKHGSVTANDVMMRQTLVDTLTRYLSVTQQSLMAFHRVTEYTFVLLQDLPACTEKRRAFRVASDLMACCTFSRAVLQAGENQDPRSALKRLFEIETWSNRAIDTLLAVEYRLKHSVE